MLLDHQLHLHVVHNGQLRAAARRREDSTSTITCHMASPLSEIHCVLFLCVWYVGTNCWMKQWFLANWKGIWQKKNHPSLVSKDAEYFIWLKRQHENQEEVMVNSAKLSEKALKAIYLVAEIVAKSKKNPHNRWDCNPTSMQNHR